jgi:uroporphyrinogen-III synthase
MAPNRINILCTRPLNESLVKDAKQSGIDINMLSFIETEPVQSIEVQQEIEQALLQTVTVVFTSMNAVEAVATYMEELKPEWSVYCIGNTTEKLVEKYFGQHSIAGTAASATELAEQMIEDDVNGEVFFFCGNQRREELPELLQSAGIDVTELVVYNTIATPHKIDKIYNGILFFSPSAAESFFSVNKIDKQTILFAIGNTTAAVLKKFTANRIIIGDEPGKENLVKCMIDFFMGK